MRKINTNKMAEETWTSPKGKFVGSGKEVSEALGRKPLSTDLNERHPFDVEICRIPPGKTPYPETEHAEESCSCGLRGASEDGDSDRLLEMGTGPTLIRSFAAV